MHKKNQVSVWLIERNGRALWSQANTVDGGQKLSIVGQTAASRADLACTSTLFGYTRGAVNFLWEDKPSLVLVWLGLLYLQNFSII